MFVCLFVYFFSCLVGLAFFLIIKKTFCYKSSQISPSVLGIMELTVCLYLVGRNCDQHNRKMFLFVQELNWNKVFSHDVTAGILVSENNETAARLEYQDNPVGVELFSYANAFLCSNKFA